MSEVKVTQSCLTLCDPMDYIVPGILQAKILEWVAFPFSRGSSQPRDQTQVSRIAGRFFTSWATRETWCKWDSGPDVDQCGEWICEDCWVKRIPTPSEVGRWVVATSVQFSYSVVSRSLQPHESQHARPPCPSPTPGVHPDSCPSSQWCHPAISFSVVPFSSCPRSLPASESFPMSQLFAWGGQSTGVSALALSNF